MTQPHAGRPRKEKPPFAPFSGLGWRRLDDFTLGRLIGRGMGAQDAASALGRTAGAVRVRARRFGADFLPRHVGETGISASISTDALAALERRAEAAGLSLAYFVGLLLTEATKPEWATILDNMVASAREEA